ncbi:MAG: UvrD-helicase domain-containing protein [Victivallaceae bacterium]
MTFDILSAQTQILGENFLEASAGTGKTFTIEHLYLRYVVEHNIDVDKILVVTFTKKATQDLQERIFSNLKNMLSLITESNTYKDLPDYLLNLLNDNVNRIDNRKNICRRLKTAINNFQDNAIFTIHGFCSKVLRKYLPGQILHDHVGNEYDKLKNEIRKYFKNQKFKDLLLKNQLKLLYQKYPFSYGDYSNSLEEIILKEILNKNPSKTSSTDNTREPLHNSFLKIKNEFSFLSSQEIFDLLKTDAKHFKDICSTKKEIKSFFLESLSGLSESLANVDISLLKTNDICRLNCTNRKKTASNKSLSGLLNRLHQLNVFNMISKFLNLEIIIELIVYDIKIHIENSDLHLSINDQLILTECLITTQPQIAQKIRDDFTCVMIDEFQDTDILQWKIFSTLYIGLSPPKNIFLIGDPKQAIYGFRNADVYTYAKAKTFFETKGKTSSLNVSYRSIPRLTDCLNFFFTYAASLMTLPKTGGYIPYTSIENPPNSAEDPSKEKPCQIIVDQNETNVFKRICFEIKKLNTQKNIPLKKIAVLFRDKKQIERFIRISSCLPTTVFSGKSITKSLAFEALFSLLASIYSPHDEGKLYKALCTPLFFLSIEDFIQNKFYYLELFSSFRKILINKGILALFKEIVRRRGPKILQNIHHSFYEDLSHLCELLNKKVHCVESYLIYLQILKNSGNQNLDEINQTGDSELDAVHLLTIHASKGLEYDAVFVPGLDYGTRQTSSDRMEENAEKSRLTYVALTRAKKYLFIPLTLKSYESINEGQPATPISRLLFEIEKNTKISIEKLAEQEKSPFAFFTNESPIKDSSVSSETKLIPPGTFDIPIWEEPIILSFSGLKQVIQTNHQIIENDECLFLHHEPDASDLPLGPQTGTIIHKIIEKLNWSIFKQPENTSEIISFISPFLQNTPLSGYESYIADMLNKVFNTPIIIDNETIVLNRISSDKILKEADFHLYNDNFSFSKNKYWKGTIDVFFEYNGHYYAIDWKMTYAGGNSENYNESALLKLLEENLLNYQAAIYRTACKKYLELFNKENLFKSIIFIFLRGIDKYGQGVVTL